MRNLNIIFIIIIALLFQFTKCDRNQNVNSVQVSTTLGIIKGSIMKSRLNKTIYSFRGIRYGEPPVGEKRFQPPSPVKPWTDIFDASEEGPSCPRPGVNSSSEDCLRLNVYTMKLPTSEDNIKRPVIVYIHPGALYMHSGQSFENGPQYLMEKDLVLVTINYRLGSLGFLSTGDSLIPGNMGLKDQVIALRWVRDNIEHFGGDPNCVTIAGYSAGSWSVILHMLSPMSQDLFHRVIAMSGSPTFQGGTPKHQKHYVIIQAQILNCSTENLVDAVKCLKTKSVEEFPNTLDRFKDFDDTIIKWRPVIEPEVPGVERFLTDDPEKLIQQGKIANVPIIIGTDKDEFGGLIIPILARVEQGDNTIFDQWNTDWYQVAPINFMYEKEPPRSHQISDVFKEFYFNNQNISISNIQGIADLYADSIVTFSVHRLVNLMSIHCSNPLYYYNFVFQGRYSRKYYPNTTKPYGVVHSDELQYLFKLPGFSLLTSEDPELIAVERMTTMFEHFAKTGVPFKENDELFSRVKWQKFNLQNKAYLEIGDGLVMKSNLRERRMAIWDSLFPIQSVT